MSLKEELVDTCHRVYEKGFVVAFDGNLSARIDEHRSLITQSGVNKADITHEDFLTIDNDGNLIGGDDKITTELNLHLNLYNNRPEINSIIHCHPIYTTAIATSMEKFEHVSKNEIIELYSIVEDTYGIKINEKNKVIS